MSKQKKKRQKRPAELQALKVAITNTLKTRVVKSKKTYTRKMKHKKLEPSSFFMSFLANRLLFS
ncbi:hypothetical protein R9C00_23470 [Flammeovirgaceae bacterium SG7u.111]|nr:hypothetical protein [Flammeovirgaceae bacterium SG7u.132]WPO34665.1 hypothetical protein R9C00_23470 [Flammeovirgaceae bacterium SG7u.111]